MLEVRQTLALVELDNIEGFIKTIEIIKDYPDKKLYSLHLEEQYMENLTRYQ